MFYARFQGGTIDNLFTTGNGMYQTSLSLANTQPSQLAAGPTFPNALASAPHRRQRGRGRPPVHGAESQARLTPNKAISTLQRQLSSDIAMSVSYIWSRGVQLYGIRDLNLPTATTNFTYAIDDTSGNAVGSYTTPV